MNFINDKKVTLANEINALMFVFEDIFKLPQDTINKIFGKANELDADNFYVACKTLSIRKDIALDGLMGKGLKMAQDGIADQPPMPAKDVHDAQNKIVAMVKEMEENGEIVILASGEEMV